MQRREFLTLLAGAAAGSGLSPFSARTEPAQSKRLGVLMSVGGDPELPLRTATFVQALQDLGWTDRKNLRIDFRWAVGGRARGEVAEMVRLKPDVILANGNPALAAAQQATRTIPIVFVGIAEPVSRGFVPSWRQPGGNATGFANINLDMGAKMLETLKEIAPQLTEVAVLRDPTFGARGGLPAAIQDAAMKLGVKVVAVQQRVVQQMHEAIAIARRRGAGLLVLPAPLAAAHRDRLVADANRFKMPAIYPYRDYVTSGGLISYSVDTADVYRRAAASVDQILKGAKPADIPLQAPQKFEIAINARTAKESGITIPPALLAKADEVIE